MICFLNKIALRIALYGLTASDDLFCFCLDIFETIKNPSNTPLDSVYQNPKILISQPSFLCYIFCLYCLINVASRGLRVEMNIYDSATGL